MKGRWSAGDEDPVRLYLESIGRYPLLDKEEEKRLALAIEAGRVAAAQLLDAAGDRADGAPTLTPSRARELRLTERAGVAATEAFINANLRLVVSIAKKYQASDLPLLDLIQEGNLGLIRAVEKFDWRKGFKFSTYATWWIRQAIGRGIDNTARTVRLPVHAGDQIRRILRARSQLEGRLGRLPTAAEVAEHLQVPESDVVAMLRYDAELISLASPVGVDGDTELADIVSDQFAPTPFDLVADAMLAGEVDKLLSILDDRERHILRLRYGLDRGEPRTLEEVGIALDLTRERIRQIERGALAKLRRPLAGGAARDLIAS